MAGPNPFSTAHVSVEYFPPKGLSAERSLLTGAHALRRFKPSFQTITFGAGGTGTEGALEWSTQLQNLNEVPTASHLALCHFTSPQEVRDFVAHLWELNIHRLVLLRGDVADGAGDGLAGYESVAHAVRDITEQHGFDISVAAYPEVHPKAGSLEDDLAVLKAKQDAGADRAITQYFFDNSDFYRFCEQARANDIRIPIVPGVIPIANFERIKDFSRKCAASVPAHFEELFAKAGDDKAAHTDVARSIIEEQVRDLAQNGVDQLHIYSLNRVDLTADAIRAFQAEFEGDEEEFRPALAG